MKALILSSTARFIGCKAGAGSTDLPRYFITLAGEIIFDYPKDFVLKSGGVKSLAQGALTKIYPYGNDISDIGELIREYIDTPKDELFAKHFDEGGWGLANILKAPTNASAKGGCKF